MQSLFQMMLENESSLFTNLLNDFSYLLKTSHIKRLLHLITKLSPDSMPKALSLLLSSTPFKQVYLHKVSSLTSYKSSFEQFFDKYLDKFSKSKACTEVLTRILSTSPFSAGFASFLIQRKRKCEGLFSTSLE